MHGVPSWQVSQKPDLFNFPNLWDVVDGGLHAAELRGLDVQHLQDIVGQRVDQVGYAGQRLGGVVFGLLQRPLLVWRLKKKNGYLTFKGMICISWKANDAGWATFRLQDSCTFVVLVVLRWVWQFRQGPCQNTEEIPQGAFTHFQGYF